MALVRPILEYASITWSPSSSRGITRLERVQKLFTRVAIRLMPFSARPPYVGRCQLLGIDSLEKRRHIAQSCFTAGLILSTIDVPDLLSTIHIYVPSRSRRPRPLLASPTRRNLYCHNDPC